MRIEDVSVAVARCYDAMAVLEGELNRADAAIGDGDTGGMLVRVIHKMVTEDLSAQPDLGGAFGALAKAALAGTGSSLGTLFATGLMSVAKSTRGREAIDWSELSQLLDAARNAMIARGGASLGDKTVLDAINAVSVATRGLDDRTTLTERAREAAKAVLVEFRDRPCKIGRARMFAEKSIGIDDPGMLAFVGLLTAITR